MRRSKSIDELYTEVMDCDLVITNDAPLATALNSRVRKATIGSFAYTPRQIAGKEAVRVLGRGVMGDLRTISSIVEETGFDFKYVHGELENIRTIRRYRANPENYLYSPSSKEVYRSFAALPTIEKVMASYDPSKSELYRGRGNVAVIGLDLFDDLDKHFVPSEFKDVDLFADDDYDIEVIRQVGNDRQIAENIVSLITPEMSEDSAIVLDTEGAVADAVRSALYRRGLPFKNKMSVRDLSQIRDFLQFLSLGLGYDTLRMRHVRELFSNYGGYVRSKQDEYLLSKNIDNLRNERAVRLAEVMRDLRSMTFGEVMTEVVHPMQRPQVRILLDDLMVTDQKITSKLVSQMMYAVNNVADLHHNEQIPDDEKRGVLLVDCKNSVYVDRPFIVFVGIGPEWSTSVIGKEYIDREEEAEKDVKRFSVLLQQGESRVYAVNLMRGGKQARPCELFESIYDDRVIEGFGDICDELVCGPWYSEECRIFSKKGDEFVDRVPVTDWKFSKSTYDLFRQCPRAYMFGDLMRTPDSEYTVFGSMVHEFAEFYLCYPDTVRSKGLDHYIDSMQSRFSGISCSQMEGVDRTRMRASMLNVMRYLDRMAPNNVRLDRSNSKRKYPNMLMSSEGYDLYSSITETDFRSSKDPMFGEFDLVTGALITDYKTGGSKKISEIRDGMIAAVDHPEFQPIIYLALLHQSLGRLPCRFNQLYVADNPMESLTDDSYDVMRNVRAIEFVDSDFEGYIRNEDCCLKSDFGKTYSKFCDSWGAFIDVLSAFGWDRIGECSNDEGLRESVLAAIGMNVNKTNMGNAKKAIDKIAKMISGHMFCNGILVIPRDTMDDFLCRLRNDHDTVSDMTVSMFDANPLKGCSKCNYVKACTMYMSKTEGSGDSSGEE